MVWLTLSIIGLVFDLIAWLTAPFFVLLATPTGYYPSWLCWLAPVKSNLDGDQGWNDPASHPTIAKLPRYLRRVLWVWRNPAQGYDMVAAADILANEPVKLYGNPLVGTTSAVYGWLYAVVDGYWVFYVCLPTFPNMRLRVYCGWKLMDFIHNPTAPDTAQLTIGANPFMNRS